MSVARRTVVGVLLLAAVVLLAALTAPAGAAAARATSFSLYSDAGDFIGQGRQRVFHPGNTSQLSVTVEGDRIIAFGVGGPYDEGYSVSIAAPRGQTLEPRNYVDAQRLEFRDPGHAGLDVEGMGRGCNELSGRFELRDLAFDAAGRVSRLWVVFQQHCEHAYAAAHGEVRFDAPVPDDRTAVAPGVVRWAPLDAWRTVQPAPVTYRGASPITRVAVEGAHARDFPLTADGCTGRAGPCEVGVGFTPTAAGSRTAVLRLTDATGAGHGVPLEGFLHGGTTEAEFEVLPGDVAGQPGRYAYTPANARFGATAYAHEASLGLQAPDGASWSGDFHTGAAALATGSYTAPSASPSGSPALWIYGRPTGCNPVGGEFTVHRFARLPDGSMREFEASFVQRCYDDRREALRGTWRFRSRDTSPLAPWMEPGPRPRIDVPADAAAPGPAPSPQTAGSTEGTALTTSTLAGPSDTTSPAAAALLAGGIPRADVRAIRAACPGRIERVARAMPGTARADRLRGSRRSDVLAGGRGADVLLGNGGRDCLVGGAGRDRLHGGDGGDVLLGGAGDDVLVGGRGRDLLDCGPGRRDRAVASRGDRTRGCERVRRKRRR